MPHGRKPLGLALAIGLLVPSAISLAEPRGSLPRYRNFGLAIYCRVDDVRRMAEGDWLERNYDALAKDLKIGKVYLETHRGMVMNDRETMLKAKRFFESRGIKTAGGITLVEDEGREFKSFCYTNPEHRQHVEKVVRFTAGLFDELILDDFFFTTCKAESEIEAKGKRTWTDFRLDLMREAAQSLVVGPAKAVNPRIKVVIKYPNWYEHFPYAGFDLDAEPKIFDGIYTGTETRDPIHTHQHLQEYQSYSIMRYFENVKPGGNGGGWVDPYARVTLDRYAEQIALTVLAKAREITLFCFSSLLNPIREADGSMTAASRVAPAAGETLARADAILSRLGNPVGVSSYKPHQSSGEDFLHSFLGMIGIPIELTPDFHEEAPVVLLDEAARYDSGIVGRIDRQLRAGKSVVMTSGLLRALQGRGIEQIVDLEVTDRKLLTRTFSSFRDVFEADHDILLPQVRYATNDSWEEITALSGANGFPLLHHADYGKGRLFVLTIPDNFADLYALPVPALNRIRQVATTGLPVRLEGPSRIALLVYDNGTCVVHSFLDRMATVDLVVDGRAAAAVDLQTGVAVPGQTRGDSTAFSVVLQPHSYRACEIRAVSPAR
jgi:hypothetical protein